MIVDLPDTTTNAIAKALVNLREEGGAVALGRVLTLIIATPLGDEEEAIEAANAASREHPMRVIVLSKHPDGRQREAARLDAEIRVGGDAGASEVIVLRAFGDTAADEEGLVTGLLLPDAPVVVWWPQRRAGQPEQLAAGQDRSATDHRCRGRGQPAAGAREPRGQLLPRRHRFRLDAPDPVARAAGRGARPAALRGRHRHPGRRIVRLPFDRAARRLAAAAARGSRHPGHHEPGRRHERHPRRAPRAPQRPRRPRAAPARTSRP